MPTARFMDIQKIFLPSEPCTYETCFAFYARLGWWANGVR